MLSYLHLPSLVKSKEDCFNANMGLETLILSKLAKCGETSFCQNQKMKKLELPELIESANSCFKLNFGLEHLFLPKLRNCGVYSFNKS